MEAAIFPWAPLLDVVLLVIPVSVPIHRVRRSQAVQENATPISRIPMPPQLALPTQTKVLPAPITLLARSVFLPPPLLVPP
jgi:hypothetical protein